MNRPFYLVSKATDSNYPYFFRNSLIDKHIYLMQESFDVPNALFIIDTWNKYKFNPGKVERYESLEIPHTIYYYKSNKDITREKINGGNENLKVMVFKKDNKINVVAMLKYN